MSPEKDRKTETWKANLVVAQGYGLSPEVFISDNCGSIIAALSKMIEEGEMDGEIQIDVFHSIKELGGEVYTIQRKVASL